jgi:RNA recognition motif-containing protein
LGIGPDGRKTGDAYVEFPNAEQANEALKRNKEKIANRYIELFRSSYQELLAVKSMMNCYMYPIPMYPMYPPIPPQQMMEFVPPTNSEEHQFSEHVVRIRGLPYSCDEVDVADFFKDLNIAPHGIHLIFNQYNKPTGEAYVEFDTAEDVEEALKLHKQMMGDRYIEVFKSSKSEMVSACMDPTIMDTMMYIPEGMPMVGMMDPYYGYPPYPYNGYYPPYMDYYGNGYYNNGYYPKKYYAKKDGKTLKLRGLPFDSTVEDIIEFFKGYKIDENTITFAMNMDGRPTGEAWVTFADKEESQRALKERNRCHIGKRYIELFLIS